MYRSSAQHANHLLISGLSFRDASQSAFFAPCHLFVVDSKRFVDARDEGWCNYLEKRGGLEVKISSENSSDTITQLIK